MTSTDTPHQPKHLKQYENITGHCCFSGCTPMGCSGGCCARMMMHNNRCYLSPTRIHDEIEHEIYVANGLRKHLARPCSHVVTRPSTAGEPGRWICKDCGEPDPHKGDLL